MKLVSACLLGVRCNYAGGSWKLPGLVEEFGSGGLFPLCPEVLGGLPVPRTPAEIQGGGGEDVLDGKARVVAEDGSDVTAAFLRGARLALDIASAVGAREAVLTERSPSCGCGVIFDGTHSFRYKRGNGVTAALLLRNGIRVRPAVVDPTLPGPREP